MAKKYLVEVSDTEYKCDDGSVMRREEGLTPNGNRINGRWVLRTPTGEWVDVDQYHSDLAERYGFTVVYKR